MPPHDDLERGDVAVVAEAGSTDPEIVTFLERSTPFDGPLVLRVDGRDRALGEKVAHHIYVKKELSA